VKTLGYFEFFVKRERFQTKGVRKIRTIILSLISPPPEIVTLRDNELKMVKRDRPEMTKRCDTETMRLRAG